MSWDWAKHGKDKRGNTKDRRARKLWLLSTPAFGGDGYSVKCHWCSTMLTLSTMSADRYPLCGHKGGSYRRENVVPSCASCNERRCGNGTGCLNDEENHEEKEREAIRSDGFGPVGSIPDDGIPF